RACAQPKRGEQAMTNEIRPALSEEEWRRGYAKRALRVTTGVQGYITVAGELGGAGTRDPATMHVIAALALYGQPFGFTWEDVDELLEQAERSDFADATGDNAGYGMDGGHCRDLAARIAALLPPREEG